MVSKEPIGLSISKFNFHLVSVIFLLSLLSFFPYHDRRRQALIHFKTPSIYFLFFKNKSSVYFLNKMYLLFYKRNISSIFVTTKKKKAYNPSHYILQKKTMNREIKYIGCILLPIVLHYFLALKLINLRQHIPMNSMPMVTAACNMEQEVAKTFKLQKLHLHKRHRRSNTTWLEHLFQ